MKKSGFDIEESERRFLYKATLREAIEAGYDGEDDEKQRTVTSMRLPLWLRKIFADVHENYNLPLYVVTSRTVRMGTSRLQKEYGEQIKELKRLWKEIRWTDNSLISRLEDYTYTVNSMTDIKRKTVVMPKWCDKAINDIVGSLNTNKSGMVRLAMYLALRADISGMISTKSKKHIETEIGKFDKQIDDSIKTLSKLVEVVKEEGVAHR